MSDTRPARGTRDFLPLDCRRRDYVIGIIRKIYSLYGYQPLETPAIENLDVLLGKYGEEGNQLIFRILKRGEKLDLQNAESANDLADLALRYDLTVPLARVFANYESKLPRLFKRFQIQPVWRADRPARGRFREFFQCDVDAVGSESVLVEVELLSAVSDVLLELGFTDFVIRINHRRLLEELAFSAGIKPEEFPQAAIALDKLDKIGRDNVAAELADRGFDQKVANDFLQLLGALLGDNNEASVNTNEHFNSSAMEFLSGNPLFSESKGLADLKNILEYSNYTSASGRLRFDPTLARGLAYYTGSIFEINVPDLSGSLGGGGRYDNLIGMFSGKKIPACGFSLGLERILVVMEERSMFPDEVLHDAGLDAVILSMDERFYDWALIIADNLRAFGFSSSVYPEFGKPGKLLRAADQLGARFACIIGEEEYNNHKFVIKNLSTGSQQIAGLEDWTQIIQELSTGPEN
jgi:histidyl-tRNA synthetase